MNIKIWAIAALCLSLVGPAGAVTFTDLGETINGINIRVTQDGSFVLFQSQFHPEPCTVHDVSSGTSISFAPPEPCWDIRNGTGGLGWEVFVSNGVWYNDVDTTGPVNQAIEALLPTCTSTPRHARAASEVSGPGQIRCVGISNGVSPTTAAVWTDVGMFQPPGLGGNPGPHTGSFFAVSPTGASAAGRMLEPTLFTQRPFFYLAGDTYGFLMQTFDTFRYGQVNAIADTPGTIGNFTAVGETIKEECSGNPIVCVEVSRAIRWVGEEGSPYNLHGTRATSTNRDGSLVGGEANGPPGHGAMTAFPTALATSRAVIWTDSVGSAYPHDLNTFVAGSNPVPPGWALNRTVDVALDADIFVGVGRDNLGRKRAWMIDMEGTPVPEPETGIMLAFGALGLVTLRRLKDGAATVA